MTLANRYPPPQSYGAKVAQAHLGRKYLVELAYFERASSP